MFIVMWIVLSYLQLNIGNLKKSNSNPKNPSTTLLYTKSKHNISTVAKNKNVNFFVSLNLGVPVEGG